MTKIAITPNVSGTGTFTLTAPDSNTDRTLTLPDAAGTVFLSDASNTIQPSNISDGTTSVGTGYVVNGAAKAWGHVDVASGVPSLGGSYNVSSVSDLAIGRVGVNFTNAMANSVYAAPSSTDNSINGSYGFATTSVNLFNNGNVGSPGDPVTYVGSIQGDLA